MNLANILTRRRVCLSLGLALGLFLVPPTLHAQQKDKEPPAVINPAEVKLIRVPFETIKTKHMIVKIMVNGKGPFTVIFDTGAPTHLLSNKVAKEGDLFGKDFKKPFLSFFGIMGEVKIKTLELGDAKVEGSTATIMDHPYLTQMAEALNISLEGLVGFTFFARYKMTIDYQAKEMTFVPNGYIPKEMNAEKMAEMMSNGANTKKKFLAPGALFGVRVSKDAKDENPGVNIREVFAGSPAALAGLKTGDRLLTLDHRWTDTVLDTFEAATSLRPGTEVPVVILRNGKEETRMLKLQMGPGL